MSDKERVDNVVLERAAQAALNLATNRKWSEVTVFDIAHEAGLDLDKLYDLGGKSALIAEIDRQFDLAMGKGFSPLEANAGQEMKRQRLIDVVMQRFEALEEHREAMENILEYVQSSPTELTLAASRRFRSAKWALAVSGMEDNIVHAKVAALAATFFSAMNVWLEDGGQLFRTRKTVETDIKRYADWIMDLESAGGWVADKFNSLRRSFNKKRDDEFTPQDFEDYPDEKPEPDKRGL